MYNYAVYVTDETEEVVELFENTDFRVYEVKDNIVKASIGERQLEESKFEDKLSDLDDVLVFIRLLSNDNSGSVLVATYKIKNNSSVKIDSEFSGESSRHDFIYNFENKMYLKADKKHI